MYWGLGKFAVTGPWVCYIGPAGLGIFLWGGASEVLTDMSIRFQRSYPAWIRNFDTHKRPVRLDCGTVIVP